MSGTRRPLVHPAAIVIAPVPAMVVVLVTDRLIFGLVAVALSLLVAFARGLRAGLALLGVVAVAGAVLWIGFAASLPRQPDEALVTWLPVPITWDGLTVATRGTLRVVGVMALFVASALWARWRVLTDTCIGLWRSPYRLFDVTGLGRRFAVLIRSDIAAVRAQALLRSRGRRLRAARASARMTVPVLMAAFRHTDQLAIAMDARGFGSSPTRTVHDAWPLRIGDAVFVVAVWAATWALALC